MNIVSPFKNFEQEATDASYACYASINTLMSLVFDNICEDFFVFFEWLLYQHLINF